MTAAALAQASPAGAADKVVQAGRVVSVDGKVLVRQDGGTAGAVAAKPGDEVKEGDVINTASNGKLKLLLADKTILDLGPSALFKVQKFDPAHGGDRNVDLQMAYGTVRASVSQPIAKGGKFQIRTRTATMGVRGTEFIVQTAMDASSGKSGSGDSKGDGGKGGSSQAAPATKITVVQGKVEVAQTAASAPKDTGRGTASSAPKSTPVMLTAGTQLTAAANAPVAKPITLTAAALSEVTAQTKVADNTFQKAVNLNLSADGGGGSGSGGGGNSAAGQATLAAIQVAVSSNVAASPQAISSVGFIGVPTAALPAPPPLPPNPFSHIHIVVK